MADAQTDKPVLMFFAGPSGAGKSTLVQAARFPDHLSSDELQKQANGGSATNVSRRASNLAATEEAAFWQDRLANPASFSTERPLHQTGTLDLIADANRAGYAVQVAFVAAGNADDHVTRVAARVAEGEHAVSEKEVRSIHARSMENLQRLFEGAAANTIERIEVYNNEGPGPVLALVIDQGKVAFLAPVPDWLQEALENTPFQIDRLQSAERYGLPLSAVDPANAVRTAAIEKQIDPPAAFAYDETAEMFGEQGIREDMDEARGRLLRGIDPAQIVRDIAHQHGYSSPTREYADTLVSHIETALQEELEQIPDLTGSFRPTAPLPAIRRNQYNEPDRQAAQERVASAIEADPQPSFDAYNADPRSLDGRYICSDLFKETFPEFAASSEGRARYNNPLHNSAAVLAAAQLTRAIEDQTHPERDTVVFLTGVPGAGKTSAVIKGGEPETNIRAIFEGQLASPQSSIEKIQAVIDAGLKPAVLVVHTAPEFALQNTLSRFEREGRGASLHAMSTIQSQLPAGLAAIRDTFGDAVRFDIFDRTAGLNQTVTHTGWDNLSIVEKEGTYADIHKRLTAALDQHHAAGTISEDGYRQAAGRPTLAQPGQAVQQDAGRPQQLPQRGLDAPEVERRGALRFWQEQTAAGETIKHAAGRLSVPGEDRFPRDLSAQRAVSQGTGYHAGHLIGHQFGGPEITGNLSLQNHEMNQGGGTYYNQESRWAGTLKEGIAVAIHVKETTRADDPAFLYRTVESVTTTPGGEVTRDSIAFLNPESERARTATGKTLEPMDTPAQVYYLAPERSQSSPLVTARLTDDDVTNLLEAKHGDDQRGRAEELLTILKATETVAALDGRAQLGYDPDRELFYATLRAADKPLLDERLKELQEKTVERDQQRNRSRERGSSHERD